MTSDPAEGKGEKSEGGEVKEGGGEEGEGEKKAPLEGQKIIEKSFSC